MSLMDILSQYAKSASPQPGTGAHFDTVIQNTGTGHVAQGLGDTFRSDQTPPFGEMVAQLFRTSNADQRAGLLNQLMRSAGPAVLSQLGSAFSGAATIPGDPAAVPASVTPEQAQQVTPEQVREMAAHAEKRNPGIVDQVSDFYSRHPDLVKNVGASILAVFLAKMAKR